MDDMTFWTLIDRTRKASGNDGNIQADLLTTELARLSEDEIVSFDNIFEEQMLNFSQHFETGGKNLKRCWLMPQEPDFFLLCD